MTDQIDDLLGVEVALRDGRPRVTLRGELDLVTGDGLEHRLVGLLREGCDELTIDLSDLEFMDVSGLRLLLRCREAAAEGGTGLQVIPGTGLPRRVMEICGVLELFGDGDGDGDGGPPTS